MMAWDWICPKCHSANSLEDNAPTCRNCSAPRPLSSTRTTPAVPAPPEGETTERIRQRWIHADGRRLDWSTYGSAIRGVQAVKDIVTLLSQLEAAEARADAVEQEARMGHVRLDECSDGVETKGKPLYDRISAKIQKLAEENTERGHIIAACAAEADILRARAHAAEHRQAAAEYRAQRIVLDQELRDKLLASEQARASLAQEHRELLTALKHMQHCGECAEDSWLLCEGGKAAMDALATAEARLPSGKE